MKFVAKTLSIHCGDDRHLHVKEAVVLEEVVSCMSKSMTDSCDGSNLINQQRDNNERGYTSTKRQATMI